MKLLHVVGARPQFMKLHPLLRELNKTNIVSKGLPIISYKNYIINSNFLRKLTLTVLLLLLDILIFKLKTLFFI